MKTYTPTNWITWTDGRKYEPAVITSGANMFATNADDSDYLRALLSERPDSKTRLTPANARGIAATLKSNTLAIIRDWSDNSAIAAKRDSNGMPIDPSTCLYRQARTIACKVLDL